MAPADLGLYLGRYGIELDVSGRSSGAASRVCCGGTASGGGDGHHGGLIHASNRQLTEKTD